MKNFKVRKKLFISFGIVLVMFVISTVAVAVSLQQIKSKLQEFYDVPWQTKGAAQGLMTNLSEQQKNLYRAIATTDEAIINPALEEVESYGNLIRENLAVIESKALKQNMDVVVDLENKVAEWEKVKDIVVAMAADTSNSSNDISAYMNENAVTIIQELNASLKSTVEKTNETGENMILETNTLQIFTTVLLLVMCSGSILVGIILCIRITRGITEPLKELENVSNQMAEGNLRVTISYQSEDEIGKVANGMRIMTDRVSYYVGELSDAMEQLSSGDLNVKQREPFLGDFSKLQMAIRKLIGSLNTALTNINEASTQVDTGSSQLAESAQDLARGATDQAASVEELEATATVIAEQVKENAQQSREARAKTLDAKREAEESNQNMSHMAVAMERINETSKKIQNIIAEIEDIASQTNMLSLNASIEAARAGEAGRGFAVVAGQIGRLAADSAQSAVNTRELIETSIQEVENGNSITQKTADSLLKVVRSLGEIAEMSDKSAESSEQQEKSMDEIRLGIGQISNVVQNNSAVAEETSATSEELYAQASTLSGIVNQFKLRG